MNVKTSDTSIKGGTRTILNNLDEVPGKHDTRLIWKTGILSTAHIVREVLM
jgi:hypothetical protein